MPERNSSKNWAFTPSFRYGHARFRVNRALALWLSSGLLVACSAEPDPPLAGSIAMSAPNPVPGVSHAPLAPPPALDPRPALVVAPAPTPELNASLATSVAAEPEALPEAAPEALRAAIDARAGAAPSELIYAAQREVFVYERPSPSSRKLGYLRAGARVPRSGKAIFGERCPGGFYRIAPEGYVCSGPGARLESGDRVSELARVRADRSAVLPYLYGRSRFPPPPLYTKLPSESEQRAFEPELKSGRAPSASSFAAIPNDPLPELIADGGRLPTPFGYPYEASVPLAARALPDSAFALLSVFSHGARRFGLTTDLLLVPLDRIDRVTFSGFHGTVLEGNEASLAFVLSRGALLYHGSAAGGLSVARSLSYREAVVLSGRTQRISGLVYFETASGDWLRDERLLRIDLSPHPLRAAWKKNWIHISIQKQTLVAYEGKKPVYATLVSTGVDGLQDPETTRSTVQGQFLIHTKHVSASMNSDEIGDEYDLRDVPYVQYFSDNYAFHAAYWHDSFGTPKSHGCINLSPADARWLFHWTDPAVPQLWHGAFSLRSGTLVQITP